MSLLALCVLAGAVAGQGFVPARLASGSVPERQPVQAVGGGEVLLELAVDDDGAVVRVATLRDTPPFTELLRAAVASLRGKRVWIPPRRSSAQTTSTRPSAR